MTHETRLVRTQKIPGTSSTAILCGLESRYSRVATCEKGAVAIKFKEADTAEKRDAFIKQTKELAEYTKTTWPDTPEAKSAENVLGRIKLYESR